MRSVRLELTVVLDGGGAHGSRARDADLPAPERGGPGGLPPEARVVVRRAEGLELALAAVQTLRYGHRVGRRTGRL